MDQTFPPPLLHTGSDQKLHGPWEGLEVGLVGHTDCLQPLDFPGGLEIVPSEGKEYCDDEEGWNEHPVVRNSCRHHDSQEPNQKLQWMMNKK